jgi:multiple sugar transport system ATP-binding protein
MNVFDAGVTNADTVSFAVDKGPSFSFSSNELPQDARNAIGGRKRATIGVRPHNVRLGAGPNNARVVSNQWLGDQSHLALEVAGKLMVAVSHAPIAAKAGDVIAYRVGIADLHVFDCDTGKAVSHGLSVAGA